MTPTRVTTALVSLIILALAHFLYARAVRSRKIVARLNSGIDALSAGFLITDTKNRLVHWNETYPKLMNHGSYLRKGMLLEDVLRMGVKRGSYRIPGDKVEDWIAHRIAVHRDAETSLEVELGDGRWIRTMSKRTPEGDVVGVRFDITDLKCAQLNAERLSHAKSEFIGILSHELRTPLTAILGFAKLLQTKSRPVDTSDHDGFSRHAVERIIRAAETELKLVNMMLEYADLTAETQKVHITAFNLRDVVLAQFEKAKTQADQCGISISSEVTPTWVLGNPNHVIKILEHLVSNALKFTPSGGRVTITSEAGPAFANISVADTGEGIPDEDLKAIFEEFSQIRASGTRRVGGAGLGLALTKRLVELQGGEISAKSTLGEGTIVTFTLPRDLSPHDHKSV